MPGVKSKRAFPDFEKPIVEINEKINAVIRKDPSSPELEELNRKRNSIIDDIFSRLTSYQKVQLARHPMRPHTMDYIEGIFDDFVELHGDRKFGDDKAIIGGLASFKGETVMVIGHQKGRTAQENIERNFGMPHPEGYRKGLRLMKLAEKFGFPVITFIDTPGAYPGVKAEERGQSEAIATNLKEMINLRTQMIVIIIGEGGSGGALGIGIGDKILMLENAVYFVCTPEACSAILWRDSSKAEQAADTMRVTAADLKKFGIVDEIVSEPVGGAHWDYEKTFGVLKKRIGYNLGILKRTGKEKLFEKRYNKFRNMGVYEENGRS
ncbi:MAG: acetyl-CoA carboxylase carboxyltransferase subunit alpha [Elusimicrobia bacterium]|nr:acetyl-CoA carboxylase carboxyltransferase subunit alpha [Elusimicrobiota bacterium]